jgi:hypothetical protein
MNIPSCLVAALLTLTCTTSQADAGAPPAGTTWWKGNLHTHTLWSDGDDFPETVVAWYKKHGYHFLALSDHNVLSQGPKWVNPRTYRYFRGFGEEKLADYLGRFGDAWVEVREVDAALRARLLPLPATGGHMARRPPDGDMQLGDTLVRLKPLSEYRCLFEEAGRFLLIQSEEITAAFSVHVNAINIIDFIQPPAGEDPEETMRLSVNAVYAQRAATGQPMFPHVNHPNFRWAITGEQLARVEQARFFEVYNGHPQVNNAGDAVHAGLDRMWDIILTLRLAELDLDLLYGLATDDAHNYGVSGTDHAAPGRGWVMVRAAFLTPEHLIKALEAGDFYASTGVTLRDVSFDGRRYAIEIEPEAGVTYRTEFIGTRKGYDRHREPVLGDDGRRLEVTQRYSDDIGKVLAVIEGTRASYELSGDEWYVRARVVSSKPKANPYADDEPWEVAWTQPVRPAK